MFNGVTNVGKIKYLPRIPETEHKSHFEFIVIVCPTILDNKKMYDSKKWIFDANEIEVNGLNYLEIH